MQQEEGDGTWETQLGIYTEASYQHDKGAGTEVHWLTACWEPGPGSFGAGWRGMDTEVRKELT